MDPAMKKISPPLAAKVLSSPPEKVNPSTTGKVMGAAILEVTCTPHQVTKGKRKQMIAVQVNPLSTEKRLGATVLPLALPPLPVEVVVNSIKGKKRLLDNIDTSKGKTQKTSKISTIVAVVSNASPSIDRASRSRSKGSKED